MTKKVFPAISARTAAMRRSSLTRHVLREALEGLEVARRSSVRATVESVHSSSWPGVPWFMW